MVPPQLMWIGSMSHVVIALCRLSVQTVSRCTSLPQTSVQVIARDRQHRESQIRFMVE
jgi:hypothetical protein